MFWKKGSTKAPTIDVEKHEEASTQAPNKDLGALCCQKHTPACLQDFPHGLIPGIGPMPRRRPWPRRHGPGTRKLPANTVRVKHPPLSVPLHSSDPLLCTLQEMVPHRGGESF